MSQTLVIVERGQSNIVDKNSSVVAPGNGPPFYTTSHTGIRILGWNGHLTGDSWNEPCTGLVSDPTDAIDGAAHSRRAVADPLSSLGTGSALPFADALKAGGVAHNIIIVPAGLAGTGILSDWKDSGGYDTVPSNATLSGVAKDRIALAMQAPNAVLLEYWGCGETEAADSDGLHPDATLVTDLGAVYDSTNTWAAANGFNWWKASMHFLLYQLSAGYAGAPNNWPKTGQVRTAFTTIGGRGDTKLVTTDPFDGLSVHLNKPQQIARGNAGAVVALAAT